MPIYDPYSPEQELAIAAHPHHPVSTLPCPTHASHHPDLSIPASPPPTHWDSCHRHLNVNEDEWADSSASWHNRAWADSDLISTDEAAPNLTPDTNSATTTNRRLGRSSEPQNSPTTPQPQQGVTIDHRRPGVLFKMGPCTCADASAHDHSCPSPAPKLRPSHPTRASDHEHGDYGAKREERIENARRQILFGDEKVTEEVAREATGRLRESEEGIAVKVYRNGGEGVRMIEMEKWGGVEGERDEDGGDGDGDSETGEGEVIVKGGKMLWMDTSRAC